MGYLLRTGSRTVGFTVGDRQLAGAGELAGRLIEPNGASFARVQRETSL